MALAPATKWGSGERRRELRKEKGKNQASLTRGRIVYTTTVGPLFSRSVARPRGHRATETMVYTIFLGKQGKRVYTTGPEKRVYTIEPQTRKQKTDGAPRWWCIFFFPCLTSRIQAQDVEQKPGTQRKTRQGGNGQKKGKIEKTGHICTQNNILHLQRRFVIILNVRIKQVSPLIVDMRLLSSLSTP